jgi:hypothetical protein
MSVESAKKGDGDGEYSEICQVRLTVSAPFVRLRLEYYFEVL